MPSHCHHLLTI